MPSPFPGMDPYLEGLNVWHDFHHALICEISSVLNHSLPPGCFARTGTRYEVDEVEPQVHDEPLRHHYVEIRDAKHDHKLITLIEIVSPSNKRPGKDRKSYLAKQEQVLASDANLVEIDLLRDGARLLPSDNLETIVAQRIPAPDYLIVVSRSWGREECRLYFATVRQVLPVIAIPLRRDAPEVPLDVQFAANRAYDSGPYLRGAVDYRQPPVPPLRPEDAAWGEELVRSLRQ